MDGPSSYSEAARLLDGLAEWTSKIDAETDLDFNELLEGVLTGLVAFGHAMQANTAAILASGGPIGHVATVEWKKAMTDG